MDQVQWDLEDRLRKALKVGGVSREEMAEALGVSPPTISRYLRGGIVPKRGDLTVWAMKCGVTLEWLEYGDRVTTGRRATPVGARTLPKPPSRCKVIFPEPDRRQGSDRRELVGAH